jgi:transcriptional regulator
MVSTDIQGVQKGSAEMIVLAMLETRERHGYELAKLIDSTSENKVQFHVASLYPLLYRLERKGLVQGRWVEKPNERRRRFYRITPEGRKTLARHRKTWKEFVNALNRLARFDHA